MSARSECVGRAKVVLSLLLNLTILACLLLVSFAIRNPGRPKAAVYSAFRDAAKRYLLWSTSSWQDLQGRHFQIRFLPGDHPSARLVLETAEENYTQVTEMLGFTPSSPIPVVIYPDRSALGKSFGWASSESAMGVYWAGAIRVLSPLDWIDAPTPEAAAREFKEAGPMVHELAHLAIDYRARGNYPRWFTEGLAQYVERELTGFHFTADTPPGNEEWYPLSRMDAQFDSLPDQFLAYRQSLAMIDYMVQKGGFYVMGETLDSLGQGFSMDQAMQAALGWDLDQFAREFHLWTSAPIA